MKPDLVLALHQRGHVHVGSLSEEPESAVAEAINAARLHGFSRLFYGSSARDSPSMVATTDRAKSLILTMAEYPDEFEVVITTPDIYSRRIDITRKPRPDEIQEVHRTLADIVDAAEKTAIRTALKRHEWDRAKVIHELSISAATLHRKMERLGIYKT